MCDFCSGSKEREWWGQAVSRLDSYRNEQLIFGDSCRDGLRSVDHVCHIRLVIVRATSKVRLKESTFVGAVAIAEHSRLQAGDRSTSATLDRYIIETPRIIKYSTH